MNKTEGNSKEEQDVFLWQDLSQIALRYTIQKGTKSWVNVRDFEDEAKKMFTIIRKPKE